MPYREKSAWLSLIAIVVTFTPYFALVGKGGSPGSADIGVPHLKLLVAIVVIQIALMMVGHAWLAIRTPEDSKAPPDERERAILHRATVIGYYALMAMLFGMVIPFAAAGWKVIDAILFGIVVAEILKYAVVVWGFRRQA